MASASPAQSVATLSADIAPQPLTRALAAFAQQTSLQLIYVSAIAEAQQSRGARARQSLPEALASLLDRTALKFEFLNAQTVRIFAPPHDRSAITRGARATAQHAARLSFASVYGLEEVVVTAARHAEPADAAPMSQAVWTAADMEAAGIKGMAEIGALTPGVEFDFDMGVALGWRTNLVIRGVTDRHGTTTGVFVDDTPLPPARGETFGRSFPWVFDLDRVEVLRGPQGTLLGQGTLGGAIRFVTHQPSLTTFSALARTEVSTTARGAGSYEAGVAAGGPLLAGVLGFRASAWYRTEGGFIDRIDSVTGATVDSNTNRQSARSVRAALTWAPKDAVRITPSVEYQAFNLRDAPIFFDSLSNLKSGELKSDVPMRQPFNDAYYLASIRVNADFRLASLSAVSSYFSRVAALETYWTFTDTETGIWNVDLKQSVFSQEVRLASTRSDAELTWIAGALYASARKREADRSILSQGLVADESATDLRHSQLEGFGQIGLRIARGLTARYGMRVSRTRYDSVTEEAPIVRNAGAETAMTPRLELSYLTDAGNLFYFTAAKGYRSGGVYPAVTICGERPVPYPADTLWSYELGAKATLWGGRLHVEPGVFHIRMNNTQPEPVLASCNVGAYGATAVSNGFDLAVQALLTARVKLGLAMAYADAHYTQTLKSGDAVILRTGDALGSPWQAPSPWNVTASIECNYPMNGSVALDLRAEDTFHSRNPGPFYADNSASPFYVAKSRPDPSTNLLELRADLRWPRFNLALSVYNALDSQPALSNVFDIATTFRPRTVTLSATWRR